MHIDDIFKTLYPSPEKMKQFSRKHDRQPVEIPPPLFHGPEFCGLQVTSKTLFFAKIGLPVSFPRLTAAGKLQKRGEFPVGKNVLGAFWLRLHCLP